MSRFKRALAIQAVEDAAVDVQKIVIKGIPPVRMSQDEARDFITKSMASIFGDASISEQEQIKLCRKSSAEYLACGKAFGWPAEEMVFALDDAIKKAIPVETDAERRRRAAAIQAEHHRGSGLHPDAKAIHDETDETEDKHMSTPTKKHWDHEMQEFAKAQRQPGETEAQAYSRLMHKSSLMQGYYDMYKRAPADVVELQAPIRKAAAFETKGHALIAMKAAEIRKSDPKLTAEQAFSKAYTDPANRDLVEMHRRELMGDAA